MLVDFPGDMQGAALKVVSRRVLYNGKIKAGKVGYAIGPRVYFPHSHNKAIVWIIEPSTFLQDWHILEDVPDILVIPEEPENEDPEE